MTEDTTGTDRLDAVRQALDSGQGDYAVHLLQDHLQKNPRDVDALYLMASCAHAAGQLDAAISIIAGALLVAPDRSDLHYTSGTLKLQAGDARGAEAHLQAALKVDPGQAAAWVNLGNLYRSQGLLTKASGAYEAALEQDPGLVEVKTNLGFVHQLMGHADLAIRHHQEALAARPDFRLAQHNLLLAMHYSDAVSPDQIRRASLDWATANADPLPRLYSDRGQTLDPEKRLRIGFVSPDFRNHPVAWFLLPLLAGLQPDFDITLYSVVTSPDGVTEQFRNSGITFVDATLMPDESLAERIFSDGIDILIDLAGHTADNRLLVFARKPAPIQITWLGYPDITGMKAMDFRVTDEIADPESRLCGEEGETLLRLQDGFLCYRAPVDIPVAAQNRGERPLTYGSFNNLSKVTDTCIRCWSEILRENSDSRLVLKARSFNDPATREQIYEKFRLLDIPNSRIDLMGQVDGLDDHFRCYDLIDIALDTFPYNGTTTTFDALYMGRPVLTLTGDRHAGLVGASILGHLGLGELVASDVSDYVARAIAIGRDADWRKRLSSNLRERLQASPLMDGAGFSRRFSIMLGDLWRDFCHRMDGG